MKKLMIAAALTLGFAGMSQAALYNWKISDIDDVEADYLDAPFIGQNAYLMLASDWDALAVAETRTFANLQSGALTLSGGAKSAEITMGAWESGTGKQVYNDGAGDAAGADTDFYAIIANEDGYLLFALDDVKGYPSTEANPEVATVSGADVWGAYDAAGSAFVAWDAAPVPEPTSGLLLLLGVAGLALKRRRA